MIPNAEGEPDVLVFTRGTRARIGRFDEALTGS